MASTLALFIRIESFFNGGDPREVCLSRGLALELLLELLGPESSEPARKDVSQRLASRIDRL